MAIRWDQLAAAGVYLAVMLLIGYWAMKRTKTMADYVVGGGKISPAYAGFSYTANAVSSSHMVGAVGTMYASGWAYGGLYTFFVMWATLANFLLIGPRFRLVTSRIGVFTVPEYIGKRYNSKTAQIIAAAITFVLLVVLTASVLQGTATYLKTTTGLSYNAGLFVTAVFVAIYLSIGGFIADTVTDFVQGFIMIGGLLMMAVIGIQKLGGISNYLTALEGVNPLLVKLPGPNPAILALTVVWSLAALGQPQLTNRFMSVGSSKKVIRAMGWALTSYLLLAILAVFAGTAGRALWPTEFLKASDQLTGNMVVRLMPGVLPMIMLGSLLAASMSTIDSSVLVAVSSLAQDIYGKYLNPKATDKDILRISRWLTVLLVIGAAALVVKPGTVVIMLTALAFGGLGILYLPPVVIGLFWRRGTPQGAIASMLGGTVMMFIWNYLKNPRIHNFVPGVITAAILYVIVSLATPKLPEEHLERVMP